MTTYCNNANKANANAYDCKEGAVLRKKNRLYELPCELENYVYSFVEDSQHKTAYKKLYLDKTFIKFMWDNFDYKPADGNYDEDELLDFDIEDGLMCLTKDKYKYSKDMLPSHISIHYDDDVSYTVKVVGKDDLCFIRYTNNEVEEKVGDYLEEPENLLYICPHLLHINFKDASYDLGIGKEDIAKLQEDENYNLLKKLVDIDEVKDSIFNNHLCEYSNYVFGSNYIHFLENGVIVLEE
jgi:hypothetical protein